MSKTTSILGGLCLTGILIVLAILLYRDARETQPLLESNPSKPVYVDDGVTFYPKYQSVNTYQNKVVVHLGWTEDDTQNQFLVWNPIVLMIWLVICGAAMLFSVSSIDKLAGFSGGLASFLLILELIILSIAYLMWYNSLYAAAYSPLLVGLAGVVAASFLAIVVFGVGLYIVDQITG